MYKIIPNLGKQVSFDTDILSADNNFIIRYDSKEDKQNAIDKIFSSIVNFSHHVVNKLYTTYVSIHILKDILTILNNYKDMKEIIYSDIVSEYFELFFKDEHSLIKEKFNKEFGLPLDVIENVFNIHSSLILTPSISELELYKFHKEINHFDFVFKFDFNDLELYSHIFENQCGKHIQTTKCIPYSLKTNINTDDSKIVVFSDSIIDMDFSINLNNYFSKDQLIFVNKLNCFIEKYPELPMLNKNIKATNKLLNSIIEKIKIMQ